MAGLDVIWEKTAQRAKRDARFLQADVADQFATRIRSLNKEFDKSAEENRYRHGPKGLHQVLAEYWKEEAENIGLTQC